MATTRSGHDCPYCGVRGREHCKHPECRWRRCDRCRVSFDPIKGTAEEPIENR